MPTCSAGSREWLALSLFVTAACIRVGTPGGRGPDPRSMVEELLGVDRSFAAAAARTDAVLAISEMLADDVWMPARGGFARGRAEASEVVRAAFGAPRTRAEWRPIRGGISADGQHGFTIGYMSVLMPDSTRTPFKYLSYWTRRPAGWRVVAYKVARRPPGSVPLTMTEPALPPELVPPSRDSATIARHAASLIAAERAFSDRAHQVGLGRAFEEYGSADAVNMGGNASPSFVVGSRAIGRAVSGGQSGPPSPVSWGADRAIVASSGDLGVTFGLIRPNAWAPNAGASAGTPFFTVWRRRHPGDPWRYVAE